MQRVRGESGGHTAGIMGVCSYPMLVSVILNLNMYSASEQNHRCSTSPQNILGYRENPQGSTMVKYIVNCSDDLY